MKRLLVAAGAAALTLMAVTAPPASAYDDKAFAYAAGHMVLSKQIPAVLGDFGPGVTFNFTSYSSAITVCNINGKNFDAPKPVNTFRASFDGGRDGGSSVQEVVYQYSSFTAAQKAYAALAKQVKSCKAVEQGSDHDDVNNVTSTYTVTTTSGKVPLNTVVGVPGYFVNVDSLDTSNNGQGPLLRDSYTSYALVNDVIIEGDWGNEGGAGGASLKVRKALDKVVFDAIGRWVD